MSSSRVLPALPLAIAATLFPACTSDAAGRPAGDKTPSPTLLSVVTFHADAVDVTVKVEVADNPATRATGLMGRDHLDPNAGMIFVFPSEEEHSFWMRNTYIPLDMIFVSAAKKVVGVVVNAEPLTEAVRTVGAPSKYVVEVEGGYAAAHGIVGDTLVSFESVPETAVR